jgi:hypothetical protein
VAVTDAGGRLGKLRMIARGRLLLASASSSRAKSPHIVDEAAASALLSPRQVLPGAEGVGRSCGPRPRAAVEIGIIGIRRADIAHA